MEYLSNFKAWKASDGSIFDYKSECEKHEAFISKALASKKQPESDDDPIGTIYNKMLAEYDEIRVDDSFRKGFKYAMSFVKNAMTPREARTEFIAVDVFDGEAYM